MILLLLPVEPRARGRKRVLMYDSDNEETLTRRVRLDSGEKDESDDEATTISTRTKSIRLMYGISTYFLLIVQLIALNKITVISGIRRPWAREELALLLTEFTNHDKPPTYGELVKIQQKLPSLAQRSLAQIKTRAWAIIQKQVCKLDHIFSVNVCIAFTLLV